MKKEEIKIAIALSGGGMRAAVFHLGILSRLAHDDLFENVTFISTVSGGSLIMGLIYSLAGNKWPTSDQFIKDILPKIKEIIVNKDIQHDSMIRLLCKPWYLFISRTNLIADSLFKKWGIRASLNDISTMPRWIINATSYESGKSWQFIPKKRVGDYINKYIIENDIKLKDALAASAAYPGLIGPFVLFTSNYNWVEYSENNKPINPIKPLYKKLLIWDGGVYDNLGTEPLVSFNKKAEGIEYRKEFNFLIISNASKSIENEKASAFPWRRAYRLLEITMSQVNSLRTRIIMNHFCNNKNSGSYLKIGNSTEYLLKQAEYDINKANIYVSKSLNKNRVNEILNYPTNLKSPTARNFELLYRHGWEVCNYTLISRSPSLFEQKEYPPIK